jgi:hypothetical protein
MFDKAPFYIATIQNSKGKLIAIEIEEHEQQDQTEHTTDD